MSASIGAYIRPSRLPFTNGEYSELPTGPKFQQKSTARSRKLVKWCFLPAFGLLFLWWFTKDAFKAPPTPEPVKDLDPFEKCEQAIEEAHIPSLEEITSLQSVTTAVAGASGGSKHPPAWTDPAKWAKIITPDELMERVEKGEHLAPRILHQSWKTTMLPDRFQRWSKLWQTMLDETWLYVLWTDADNRKLVQKYFPDYLKSYDLLPREIYRADMVRNMYMHKFGGVYADLDLVPLTRLQESIPILTHNTSPPIPIIYLGHMGDDNYAHSIPNAFMISSTPGHPFWKIPLDFVKEHQLDDEYNAQPEGLTGPVALRTSLRKWLKETEQREGNNTFAEVRVLPNERIYPFSWYDSPLFHHCLCRPHSPFFNETRCHYAFPEAWTITYWTHSWGF
ncbi:SubName: Full=Uncharacterized protein {ECO:0000313/EMBL:CCA73803.1} [Serendipita indica DSM 11827]|uniref:Glycosyltransferase family 32 protein n=1 Tax=Serendipita indica (strain DSM 11827) TaxID=1109443 RepID=G4TR60_SERID|nr:SubName: Full=Uncharacterized protein {ECO:0000313/EMBL:CCA73803.1} [Serendipita indica DSM 11827]CCA73803.1 hypothetical protein PIIN_07757 [Serendipita indica DSM 11827]